MWRQVNQENQLLLLSGSLFSLGFQFLTGENSLDLCYFEISRKYSRHFVCDGVNHLPKKWNLFCIKKHFVFLLTPSTFQSRCTRTRKSAALTRMHHKWRIIFGETGNNKIAATIRSQYIWGCKTKWDSVPRERLVHCSLSENVTPAWQCCF